MNEHIRRQLALLNQQEKELFSIYRHVASRLGVSDSEFWVLYALLIFEGECSQQNICDMWSLPKQTVNSVVANLSKKGYLFLEPAAGARNRKIIRLTEAGMEFGKNTVFIIYEAEQRALAKMPEQERQAYITLMGRYITLLREEITEPYSESNAEKEKCE